MGSLGIMIKESNNKKRFGGEFGLGALESLIGVFEEFERRKKRKLFATSWMMMMVLCFS